jgi:hypothetical protein
MNAIAKSTRREELPQFASAPVGSPALQRALEDSRYYRPGPIWSDREWFAERPPTAEVQTEARALLGSIEEWMAKPSPTRIAAWLKPIAAAVRNPPSESDFAARCAALALMELPAAAFNTANRHQLLWNCQFWPSVADICAAMREDQARLRDWRTDLSKVAYARPASEYDAARRHAEAAADQCGPRAALLSFPSERASAVNNGF